MTTDRFITDDAGKMLICRERTFIPGNASAFCTRPQNHPGPCAFPVDPAHTADQSRIAELEADADRAARTMERSTKLVERLSRENAELRASEKALRAALQGVRGERPCFCRTKREHEVAEMFAEGKPLTHSDACVAATSALAGVLS